MENEINPADSSAAAAEFVALTPQYEVCPGNSRILVAEVLRLVEDDGLSPISVSTYQRAYENRKSALKLKEPPLPETPIQRTMEYVSPSYFRELTKDEKRAFLARLDKLSPAEIDALPDHLARPYTEYKFEESQRKPEPLVEEEILRPLLELRGLAYSVRNLGIIGSWLNKRSLSLQTESNILLAIDSCKHHMDLSEETLERMPSSEFKKRVLDPLRAKQAAEDAKKPKTERPGPPPGFSRTNWINGL